MKLTLWRESHKENLQAVCTPFLKIQDNGVFGFVSPCFLLFTPLFGSRSQVEKDISNCVCPAISSMGGGGWRSWDTCVQSYCRCPWCWSRSEQGAGGRDWAGGRSTEKAHGKGQREDLKNTALCLLCLPRCTAKQSQWNLNLERN